MYRKDKNTMTKYYVFTYFNPSGFGYYGYMKHRRIYPNRNSIYYTDGSCELYGKWSIKYIYRIVRCNHEI